MMKCNMYLMPASHVITQDAKNKINYKMKFLFNNSGAHIS